LTLKKINQKHYHRTLGIASGYLDGFKVNAHTMVLDTETTRNFGNLWVSSRDFHTLFWNEGNVSN